MSMASKESVGVGLVGSQFISSIHAEALRHVPQAHIRGVMSPTAGHARDFAAKHGIPNHFTDLDSLLARDDIDLVVVGAPNFTHCDITVKAAQAGKHVVVEKPLRAEPRRSGSHDRRLRASRVKLMYAEELCFAPKYVRLKQLLDDGRARPNPSGQAIGEARRPARGALLGCRALGRRRHHGHGLPCDRVLPLDARRRPRSRASMRRWAPASTATKTRGDDNAIIILEFENGVVALAEESWTKLGGMDDRAEVYGSEGVAYADVLHGNAIQTYSARGYGYAVEKAGSTRSGGRSPIYEEIWNYGFPQEMAHFVDCVQNDRQPLVTGEDGRAVLEIMFAAYESAGTGRKIALPSPTRAERPFDLWMKA